MRSRRLLEADINSTNSSSEKQRIYVKQDKTFPVKQDKTFPHIHNTIRNLLRLLLFTYLLGYRLWRTPRITPLEVI
jgi:hypothetical protein